EGGAVDRSVVLAGLDALSDRYDYVTMEGSGGIICPLRYDDKTLWLADLIRARDMPCLLVADAGLGTINAVALTASFMRTNGLSLRAIIFDRYDPTSEMHRDNLAMCETLTGCRVVACVREGDDRLRLPVHELKALYG
ncbi:MAG: dethiobiotin synthase, partial [Eubacteriales bacterium]|nr:dethiobiotin synthase [Eubacteriales bacterium]